MEIWTEERGDAGSDSIGRVRSSLNRRDRTGGGISACALHEDGRTFRRRFAIAENCCSWRR